MTYNELSRLFACNNSPSDGGSEGGDPNGGGGGGSSDANREADRVATAALAREGLLAKDVPEGVRKVLRRFARENYNYRETQRNLKKQIAPEGAVVLTGDEKKEYEAIKALDLKADKISEALTERDTLKVSVAEIAMRETIRSAAEVLNYKPSVLMDLVKSRGLVIEDGEVEVEKAGKKVKETVPHVKTGTENAKAEPLKDFVERDLKDYLPALTAKEAGSDGIQYPEQDGGGSRASTSGVVGKVTAKFVPPSKRNTQS